MTWASLLDYLMNIPTRKIHLKDTNYQSGSSKEQSLREILFNKIK